LSTRSLAPALASLCFAASLFAQPAADRWIKLADALPAAQAKQSLILLDLHSSALADPKGDRWIADAEAFPAAARVLDGMVLAVAGVRAAAVKELPDLATFKGQLRHLVVLDPWGGIVLEPDDGFGDIAKFAFALNALRQQTPTFIHAGALRREGKIAESLLAWAGGLLDAGAADSARGAFELAESVAKRDGNTASIQNARLGIAALDVQRLETRKNALAGLEDIAAHPASTEIASRAWMLLAFAHRVNGETRQAEEAYQKAFAFAPKPSALAEAARRHLEMLGSEPESLLQEKVAAGNVHLLYPHREIVVGDVVFGVATSSDVARVELYLDDARVAELTRRPFRTKVRLGSTPHVQTVRAVAFDAQERRRGEESVTLNDRAVALGVSIVAPKTTTVDLRTTVEMQPRLPQGSRLAGIDLFWNDTKIATMTEPPYRHELILPSRSAPGFIRAVARTVDGATAEDVKLINSSGVAEQVSVDAVQVYAIVQDRAGHYVGGLTAADFAVKEDGSEVAPRLQSASDDPIAIGMALDTSSSMQVAMTEVIDYANEFVQHALGEADQTFVVAFDEEPRVVQPLTRNRKELSAAIFDLTANGGTAIWDAALFSLQQFHGVPGKRALVVFTDGINNAGLATAKGALDYAREIGVPVYVVQIFTGVFQNLQMTFDENAIDYLTKSTGGAFFRFTGKKDLPHLFSQIRDDTRGQYLLTYVSRSTKARGELRRITVEVPGKRVNVRATSGYYPR
jgi:Ca-activated chloride channel family protein